MAARQTMVSMRDCSTIAFWRRSEHEQGWLGAIGRARNSAELPNVCCGVGPRRTAACPELLNWWISAGARRPVASCGLIEEHGLGIVMLVVLMMPARLAGEIRRWPWRSSLGSRGGLIECAQQPA